MRAISRVEKILKSADIKMSARNLVGSKIGFLCRQTRSGLNSVLENVTWKTTAYVLGTIESLEVNLKSGELLITSTIRSMGGGKISGISFNPGPKKWSIYGGDGSTSMRITSLDIW